MTTGLRDVDLGERELIRKLGATAYTMHDIDKHGIGKVMEMALDKLGERPVKSNSLHSTLFFFGGRGGSTRGQRWWYPPITGEGAPTIVLSSR